MPCPLHAIPSIEDDNLVGARKLEFDHHNAPAFQRTVAWIPGGFTAPFHKVRDKADIYHHDEDGGEKRKKHLHDIRGTFVTKLATETDLQDREMADIMGWAPDKVAHIRRVYVDQNRLIMAIGQRIKGSSVNHPVNS